MTDRRRFPTAATAAALVLIAVAGCTDDPAPADGTADGTPQVIAPGRPGEDADTLSREEAREAGGEGAEPTASDFAFMRMMVEHHEQAVEMTDLAARHADDERVRRLSERIAAAQGPEIEAMNAWLTRHAGHEADRGHGAHGPEAMPGMASREEMAELTAARGEEFDALFLDLMVRHHEGGVSMAADALAGAGDVTVEQLANDIVSTQTVEIERLRELR